MISDDRNARMSFTSFDLDAYQKMLADRVKNTLAHRAEVLATMPEFSAFLDALKDAGIGVAHVRVQRDDVVLEWGTPTEDAGDPRPIMPVSAFRDAIASGKIVPITEYRRRKRI